ncbi:MAG: hypothetical protein U0L12_07595 [Ruminococcus sp.]|nr:hypothetical protein [Ruminococcus sp.]
MKNKRNIVAILAIGILVLTAYMVPSVMAKAEDDRMKTTRKTYEIDEIKLNSSEIGYRETMSILREVLNGEVVSREAKGVDESQRDYTMVKENVGKFIEIFAMNVDAFTEFHVNYMVLVNIDFDTVYPLFSVYAANSNGEKFYFLLNAMDGMVVAFDMPYVSDIYVDIEGMTDYYGFTDSSIWWDEVISDYDDGYRELSLYFIDKTTGEEVVVPCFIRNERISCNLYPGEISVYVVEGTQSNSSES